MGNLNKVLSQVFFFTLFLGLLVLSFSSCSDDTDENLPTSEEYGDSLKCIFQQNAILGTYNCSDVCNLLPVFQDYQMVIKAHPDGCPNLLVSNFAAMNEFSNPFNGFEFSSEFAVNSALDSSIVMTFTVPQNTYYNNNNQDTLTISGDGVVYHSDTISLSYRFRINSMPEKVCVTTGIKIGP